MLSNKKIDTMFARNSFLIAKLTTSQAVCHLFGHAGAFAVYEHSDYDIVFIDVSDGLSIVYETNDEA